MPNFTMRDSRKTSWDYPQPENKNNYSIRCDQFHSRDPFNPLRSVFAENTHAKGKDRSTAGLQINKFVICMK